MKRLFLVLLLLAVAAAGLVLGFRKASEERQLEGAAEMPLIPESRAQTRTDGQVVIVLDREMQQRLGIEVQSLTRTNMVLEASGTARVLNPGPLAALVAELAAAEITRAASSNELQRVRTLARSQNASLRTVETAEATARRDAILVETLAARLEHEWGSTLARNPDLPARISQLMRRAAVLLRADLPLAVALEPLPSSARLMPLTGVHPGVTGEVLGPAPTTAAPTQGQGVLLWLGTNELHLAPGAVLRAALPLAATAQPGLFVPDSAVVRAESKLWIFTANTATEFARRELTAARLAAGGWLVTNETLTAIRAVVSGAQLLLSEELKASIPQPTD